MGYPETQTRLKKNQKQIAAFPFIRKSPSQCLLWISIGYEKEMLRSKRR